MAAAYQILHGELLVEILQRVSCIKSLGQCTSVCKYWYSLIKQPYFIANHLSQRNNTNRFRLLCTYRPNYADEQYSYSIRYDTSQCHELYKLTFPTKWTDVHGSCNGLICYSNLTVLQVHESNEFNYMNGMLFNYMNGTLYWESWANKNWELISFDLNNETFGKILLPDVAVETMLDMIIGTFGDDSIVIYDIDRVHELWLYDVCGESWTKKYDCCNVGEIIVGCRNNGEIVSRKMFQRMVAYDLQTGEGNDFGTSILGKQPNKVELFVESLVLLNGADINSC